MLAAYYYGATRDPENIDYLLDYLEVAGNDPSGEKWRWMVQAVYLARYAAKDTDRALVIAQKLTNLRLQNPEIPVWTLHMAPFILADVGEKQAARDLAKVILGSTDQIHPNEIKFMLNYIENSAEK